MGVTGTIRFVCGLGMLLAAIGAPKPSYSQTTDLSSERPPGESPTRIEVAFYLIDLIAVNDRDETFEADIFAIATWEDPRLRGERVRVLPAADVWTPNVAVFNERAVASRLPKEVEIRPDGTVTYRQRLIGTFASALDLAKFPLDTQTLEVRLVVYGNGADEVVLVESAEIPTDRSPELAINDWEIGPLTTEASSFTPVPGFEQSSLTIRLEARRLVGYYVVQLLVPLILIVAMSWIPFWVDPAVVNIRASICVTTVLTLIAYRFMIGNLVPKLPYLTLVDFVLLGSTVLVAAALTLAVAGAFLVRRDRTGLVEKTDPLVRVALPVGFLALLAAAWLLH